MKMNFLILNYTFYQIDLFMLYDSFRMMTWYEVYEHVMSYKLM